MSNTADDIDAMLQGQDQNAPASPAQTNGQVSSSNEIEQSPEEVEFSKLTGSTQDRIRKLIRDKRDAEERAQRATEINSFPPPPPGVQNPEVQNAVKTLDNVGMATKDFVQSTVNDTLSRMRYEQELERLSSAYAGTKGEPQFVRDEYEDFVQSHPQYRNYLPEDVFKEKMFHDEFLNLELSEKQSPNRNTTTLRPTRTSVQREELTPEGIEEKLKTLPESERKQWYNDHVDEINSVLGKMQAV